MSVWVAAHQLVLLSNLISTPLLMNLRQNQSQGWWLEMFRGRSLPSKQWFMGRRPPSLQQMPLCASKQCSWENRWGSH
ncbi:hypothetical protein Gogos_001009 [Gossypium gossypioides]|uniref:Secreted protein n=1 Tax=Gossypium gossypioides TaxID=34282 RepID=A0A7J9CV84_GOSGO|nr:hypothetical protein [Gossypium gossypioides]